MIKISRFEGRILLAVVLPTVAPILASLIFLPQLIEARFAELSHNEVRSQLEKHALFYREFFEAKKSEFAATARAIGRDPALVEATRSGTARELEARLRQIAADHREVRRLSVYAPDSGLIADYVRSGDAEVRPRTYVVPLGLGRPPRLELVFGLQRVFFDDRARAEDVATLYDVSLKTFGQRFAEKTQTYFSILVVVAISAVVLGFLLARSVTRRIRLLEQGTQRAAQGELDFMVPVVGRDEIANLSRRFNHMLRAVREAQRRIIDLEKISSWQDFARRLAHEIKNPLTPIRLSVQELRRRAPTDDPDFKQLVDDVSRVIEDETSRLTRLVDEFSQFARLPDGAPSRTDLAELLEEFLRGYDGFDGRVELAPTPQPLIGHVDGDQLRQVLHNLVLNGLEAGPKGKVRISAHAKQGRIRIDIDDEGPGVKAPDKTKLFEPYFTTKTTGTGLGLAIARKIVLQHRGDLTVTDAPTGGARFTLELPAFEPERT